MGLETLLEPFKGVSGVRKVAFDFGPWKKARRTEEVVDECVIAMMRDREDVEGVREGGS